MPSCNWSLLCFGATKADEGFLHAENDAQLVITFDAGSFTVARDDDGETIRVQIHRYGNLIVRTFVPVCESRAAETSRRAIA